jgi:uncharacterized membrane protein YfcA
MIWPQIPAGVEPWVYFLCVGSSVFIVGLSKAGFGGGIGIVAIPLMGAVMPPQHMLGVMLPILIAADALSNLHHLRAYEWRLLKPLFWGGAVGVATGSAAFWMLRHSNPAGFQKTLALLIGAICAAFVLIQAWGLTGRPVPTLPPHPASGVGVGCLAGFVSTLSHSAGPIVTLYLLQEKVEKRRIVGTLVFYFFLVNLSKVPTFVALGTINAATLRDSVWLVPLIPLGTLSGAWLHRRVPEKPFVILLYAAALVTAGHMIWSALARP